MRLCEPSLPAQPPARRLLDARDASGACRLRLAGRVGFAVLGLLASLDPARPLRGRAAVGRCCGCFFPGKPSECNGWLQRPVWSF